MKPVQGGMVTKRGASAGDVRCPAAACGPQRHWQGAAAPANLITGLCLTLQVQMPIHVLLHERPHLCKKRVAEADSPLSANHLYFRPCAQCL